MSSFFKGLQNKLIFKVGYLSNQEIINSVEDLDVDPNQKDKVYHMKYS